VSYLYVLNKVNHSLDIYNLTDQDFKGRIAIPKEGPFALPVPQGFFVHSQDSIFVFPQGHLKNTILLNDLGEVVLQLNPPSVENSIHALLNHISAPHLQAILLMPNYILVFYRFLQLAIPTILLKMYCFQQSMILNLINLNSLKI